MADLIMTALQEAYKLVVGVKEKLEKIEENNETCKILKDNMDLALGAIDELQKHAEHAPDDLDNFIDKLKVLCKDADSLIDDIIKRKNKGFIGKVWGAITSSPAEDERKLNQILSRWQLLMGHAALKTLVNVYRDNHVINLTVSETTWNKPVNFERACNFCHVTQKGEIIIGGKVSRSQESWSLISYDQNGEINWKTSCSEEPSDIEQITVIDSSGEYTDQYVILLEESNRLVLFRPNSSTVDIDNPVFEPTDTGYKLRRMLYFGEENRLLVALDPTGAGSMDDRAKLRAISYEDTPFSSSDENTVDLKTLDTQSLVYQSVDNQVLVLCSRPEVIKAFHIKRSKAGSIVFTQRWELETATLDNVEINPESLCAASGDMLVYDNTGERLLAATGGNEPRWRKSVLRKGDIGDSVYGMAYVQLAKRLVMLHSKQRNIRVTYFEVEFGSQK